MENYYKPLHILRQTLNKQICTLTILILYLYLNMYIGNIPMIHISHIS